MNEVRNILHLHLGCKITDGCALTPNNLLFYYGDIGLNSKLILYPLSEITDEIRNEIYDVSSCARKNILPDGYVGEDYGKKINMAILGGHAESTRLLLSKHFDLFGLIEQGYAIDATLPVNANI